MRSLSVVPFSTLEESSPVMILYDESESIQDVLFTTKMVLVTLLPAFPDLSGFAVYV